MNGFYLSEFTSIALTPRGESWESTQFDIVLTNSDNHELQGHIFITSLVPTNDLKAIEIYYSYL